MCGRPPLGSPRLVELPAVQIISYPYPLERHSLLKPSVMNCWYSGIWHNRCWFVSPSALARIARQREEGGRMARMRKVQSGRRNRTHPVCKICGCLDKFDFNVPDDVWKQVVPIKNQHDVVCLDCFDEFAFKKGVDYSESIDTLYFAGNQAVFEFHTVSAQDL
jgi:hypothetical protein